MAKMMIFLLWLLLPANVLALDFHPYTKTADRTVNEEGKNVTRFYPGPRNYLRNGSWRAIDLSIVDDGAANFSMTKAPYSFIAPRYADGVIELSNNDEGTGDIALTKFKTFPGAAHVEGELWEGGVFYRKALAEYNADLLIIPHADSVSSLIRWYDTPSQCTAGGTLYIPLLFSFSGPVSTPLTIQKKTIDGAINFSNGSRTISVRGAKIWDSAEKEKKEQKIQLQARKEGQSYIIEKVVPCDFFAGAVFPVFTDTTDVFNPSDSTDDGTASDNSDAKETFSAIRASNYLGVLVQNGTENTVSLKSHASTNGKYLRMYRTLFGFDTSALPDSDVVESATLGVTPSAHSTSLFSQSIVVDHAVPANGAAHVSDDYELTNWDGVEQATARVGTGDLQNEVEKVFTLNATGKGNVSLTGNTWYGFRYSGDFDNIAPSWSGGLDENFQVYAFENGSKYANLTVVHAPPASSSSSVASSAGAASSAAGTGAFLNAGGLTCTSYASTASGATYCVAWAYTIHSDAVRSIPRAVHYAVLSVALGLFFLFVTYTIFRGVLKYFFLRLIQR